MKFFKENPIFSIVLIVLLLAFAGGAYFAYTAYEQSLHHEQKENSAVSTLRRSLSLNPAPTEANLEAAKANLAALKQSLAQQVEVTKGTKPELLDKQPPQQGTQLLFDLGGYRDSLAREAASIIPINVNEKSVADGNIKNPGIKLADKFAFGFSRYLNTGTPPTNAQVPYLFLQKEILDYIVRQLLVTRPIEIRAVHREGLAEHRAEEAERRTSRRNDNRTQTFTDEFVVGSETAALKDAVNTIGFRIVFTGYTENLRQFMKSLEAFELPLVVRSVEVKPLESSVRGSGTSSRPGSRSSASSIEALFGVSTPASEAEVARAQQPVVAENISEFTVVIEYVTVALKDEQAN